MRIAIMTWHHYNNYGTALQLTALTDVLKQLGHNPNVINYVPDGSVNKTPTFNYVNKAINRLQKKLHSESIVDDVNGNAFEKYREKYFSYTDKCNNQSELEKLNDQYDCFICGSDQIWSPVVFDKHYFLDFVTDSNKKISYAPSFGVNKIEDANIAEAIKGYIEKIPYLSVREREGRKIIEDLGSKAQVVLDPTLLIGAKEWGAYSQQIEDEENYMFVYFLTYNKKHLKAAYSIANDLGVKVKVLPVIRQDLKNPDRITENVGPSEFLGLIKNASYVCTDSFHATLFSIMFNKSFCTFKRFSDKNKKSQNSRVYNILKELGLLNRIYTPKNKELLKKIDYSAIDEHLERLRSKSMKFLSNALNGVDNYVHEQQKIRRHVLENHSLCCGCGACKTQCKFDAITIRQDKDGFYRAFIDDEKCVRCSLCNEVCPMQGSPADVNISDSRLYSYQDNDPKILAMSSSGGIGYRLAEHLHNSSYSIVGCKYDAVQGKAVHTVLEPEEGIEGIKRYSGSKYLQSQFATALEIGKSSMHPVAFFGTPCQIAAARKIFKNNENVVLIDLICHGVPTSYLFDRYKQFLDDKHGIKNINSISFRFKDKGWHDKHIFADGDSKEYISSERTDPFMQLFTYSTCYGKQCYECRWRASSAADIRIGDYWGKRFASDERGVNMVVSLTPKGEAILNNIKQNNYGCLVERDIEDYFINQLSHNIHEPIYWNRLIMELSSSSADITQLSRKYGYPYLKRQLILEKYNAIKNKIHKK